MELYKREKYLKKIRPFYDDSDIIKVITGVRRSGKSCLMETIADELRTNGIPESSIVHIDLDSLENRSLRNPDQLESLIRKETNANGLIYLFIDEIQNVNSFEEVINGFRLEGRYSIFITGSNSYLLSGELVTKLTGRYLEFELFPLSFDEYEGMKALYSKPIDSNPIVELNNYIIEGGFPRAVQIDDIGAKRVYVKGIVDEIFEKDIRRRVRIKDRDAFESVRNYVIGNFGALTSMNNLHKALESNGFRIGRETVSKYIQILVDAKILYECPKFDIKSRRSLSGEKKFYLSDLSFYFALNTDNRINYGPVLENVVYVYARSIDYTISVGRIGKLECDFILRSPDMDYSYVQVAYTIMLSRDTEDREYRSLEKIRDNYRKYILTTDYMLQKRDGILHVNMIDFIKNQQRF